MGEIGEKISDKVSFTFDLKNKVMGLLKGTLTFKD